MKTKLFVSLLLAISFLIQIGCSVGECDSGDPIKGSKEGVDVEAYFTSELDGTGACSNTGGLVTVTSPKGIIYKSVEAGGGTATFSSKDSIKIAALFSELSDIANTDAPLVMHYRPLRQERSDHTFGLTMVLDFYDSDKPDALLLGTVHIPLEGNF